MPSWLPFCSCLLVVHLSFSLRLWRNASDLWSLATACLLFHLQWTDLWTCDISHFPATPPSQSYSLPAMAYLVFVTAFLERFFSMQTSSSNLLYFTLCKLLPYSIYYTWLSLDKLKQSARFFCLYPNAALTCKGSGGDSLHSPALSICAADLEAVTTEDSWNLTLFGKVTCASLLRVILTHRNL